MKTFFNETLNVLEVWLRVYFVLEQIVKSCF